MTELHIDIVSDVVCPWCFIGKRHLESALGELRKERADVLARIRWLPFFLNPDTPEAGEPYRPFLERKFGGPEKLAQIWGQISETGRTAGIDFAFERIDIRANTLKAHRLIHRAQERGDAGTLVERLFAAQFIEGRNVGDAAELARLAAECGEDEAAVLAYLDSGEDADAVRAGFERVQRMGITGVPFFILAGRYGVGGAQPPGPLLGALRQALAPA
ncbi:MAG: DsbA family oxidoreductase [Zoogloeaceae bacterium]|nr:DsbA family oxidoreductase [Zoogloeaceae bacterium]MCK6384778.1 DsbA family oxidoreductase [Rhodocyclaceae bacterium]